MAALYDTHTKADTITPVTLSVCTQNAAGPAPCGGVVPLHALAPRSHCP